MSRKVQILETREVFHQAIFRVREARLRHERFDGSMSPEITRLSFERGDSVAALVHDPLADSIVLAEQFRYPTLESGSGWILEIPAGVLEASETPAESLERELAEELRCTASEIQPIGCFYPSPGGSSERIHLFYVRTDGAPRDGAVGGAESENEDIRSVVLPVEDALARAADGRIEDAKTLIALQWLALRRATAGGGPAGA